MTADEKRAKLYPVILCEYNPAWPEWFAAEKTNLERLVGEGIIARINHIGSTAVPGLISKPTVDILLEINETADTDHIIAALPPPEYICLDRTMLTISTPPPHLMFLKGYTPSGFAEKVFHIHVRYPGNWDELYFRDYMITHPKAAARYAALKRELGLAFKFDRDGYTKAKSVFINEIMQKAKESVVI